MTPRTQDAIKSALFEATFVVLGVILALAANEWRQARADQEASRRALAAILEEIQANRDAVAVAMEYHHGLIAMLTAEHENEWTPTPSQFPRGFISPARTSRTAWDSASETGVLAKLDYANVVELSRVYAQQERYEFQARSVGEIIYGAIFHGGAEGIAHNHRNLASIIGSFIYRERELLEIYDEALSTHPG